MKIINHGEWSVYKPEKPYKAFEGSEAAIIYVRRASDGKDWYAYLNDEKPFRDGNVKMIVLDQGGDRVVGASVFDPTLLWPENALLLEIEGYRGDDPQKDFGGKVYDPKTGKFSERVLPPPPQTAAEAKILSALEKVMARLEALEGRSQ